MMRKYDQIASEDIYEYFTSNMKNYILMNTQSNPSVSRATTVGIIHNPFAYQTSPQRRPCWQTHRNQKPHPHQLDLCR